MLYYQLDATFHFEPYKKHGELLTEPQDKDIERINRRLQRAFASIDATPFPEFCTCCFAEHDKATFVVGLNTMSKEQALSTIEESLRDAKHWKDVRATELREISSQQLLSGLLSPAYDAGLLREFPSQLEEWDNRCEPEELEITSGIGNPAALSLEAALEEAKSLMLGDTFLAEIQRIYDPANTRALIEHPVHYLLIIRNDDNIAPVVDLVVRCLHSAGRLPSLRYDILKKFIYFPRTNEKIHQLFQTSDGATIVLVPSQITNEDEKGYFTATASESFDHLTEQIKLHRKKTLFIFIERQPQESSCKRIISDVEEELRIVELGEGMCSLSQAKTCLQQLIDKSDLAPYFHAGDGALPEQKAYTTADVQEAYSNWRSMVLRERIYPTYQKELAAMKVKKDKPKAAWQKLLNMVGLTQAKSVIQDMVAAAKLQNLRKSWGIKEQTTSRHMVFTGNPGSAKTTVARLTVKILAEENIIPKSLFIECGRANLVGKYVGWTADIVKKFFREAQGGVLFIDEAYALVEDHHSYGDEAINTIVQEMENKRESVIVILAGYPDKMKKLLDRNEGLRSRIAFHVDFPDDTPEELGEILDLMCEERGYQLTDASREKCASIFEAAVKTPNFGNGRFVRNLLEQATLRQAKRLMETDANIEKEQGLLLLPEDFETLAIPSPTENRIGFCPAKGF